MQEARYRAFISYSHRDQKWADWLHKTLETYRVPKHLVGQETPRGPVPQRLVPIFRDRDELPSATDLGQVVNEALKNSAAQIVICSPAAARSRWVNEEILAYKRYGGESRILCLIIDGEPGASAHESTAEDECFPRALRYKLGLDGELSDVPQEPIAADARPGKDGKQNAKLKLIAGLLGIGFDALKQREQHRRHQRMVAITAAALVGMVVATGLATAALLARAEAERQRIRAEAEAETARQTTSFMVDLFEVSDPSEARGNTITAREILEKGAARINTELADQPEIQATLMDTMGTVYKSLGLYPEAGTLLRDALERRQALLGLEHEEVADSLAHLAEVLGLQADYDNAEAMYRDALAKQRRLLGSDDPQVAETLVGLANVQSGKGAFEEAETLLRESLQIRREAFGDEHLTVAESLERLGVNVSQQGRYDEAESLLERAIEMRRKLLGEAPHPDLSDALNNLAYVFYEKGEYANAESLFRETLEMNRVLFGAEHPWVAVSLNNLAFLLHDQAEYDEAEQLYREVVAMRQHLLGEQHPDVAGALNNLAFLLYDRGDEAEALELAEQSVEMYRRIFPEGHPDVARTMTNLAQWYTDEGDYARAEQMLREANAMQISLLGASHPSVADSLIGLARVYVETERFEEAQQLAQDARKLYTQSLPPDHWVMAWATSLEGAALAGLMRYEAAEEMLVRSYDLLMGDSGVRRVYVESTLRYLVDLYDAWDKPDRGLKYRAEFSAGQPESK